MWAFRLLFSRLLEIKGFVIKRQLKYLAGIVGCYRKRRIDMDAGDVG